MAGWERDRIVAELKRQLDWSLATIQRIDAEKQAIEQANRKLQARRKYYTPKNNGLGRPPKPLGSMSEERRVQLARLKLEASLLSRLMPLLVKSKDPTLVLKVALESISSEKSRAVKLIWAKKLKALLKQFSVQIKPLAPGAMAWSENDVRHYFGLLAKVQKAKRGALSKMALQIEWEKIEDDRQQAVALLLDDILYSQHLESAKKLYRATEIWRQSPPAVKMQVPGRWARTWREAIDQLWYDVKKIFAVGTL